LFFKETKEAGRFIERLAMSNTARKPGRRMTEGEKAF